MCLRAWPGLYMDFYSSTDLSECESLLFFMEGNRWRFQNVERYRFPCLRSKTYRGIDIWLRSFLSSTLDRVEWSTTRLGRFITRKMTPQCPWNWWLGRCQSHSGYFGCFMYCVIMHAVSDSIISALPSLYEPCYRKTGLEKPRFGTRSTISGRQQVCFI